MCGIFCYAGAGGAIGKTLAGLKRLEYRGYDSWGLAVPGDGRIEYFKSLDPLQQAEAPLQAFDGDMAIGHTRWATHGAVNLDNSHPHLSADRRFALVHNGIVENYADLKRQLIDAGIELQSDTDTEVIMRLFERRLAASNGRSERSGHIADTLQAAFQQLKGRNTLVLLDQLQGQIIAIRHGSPLLLGRRQSEGGDEGGEKPAGAEFFLASDALSFAEYTAESAALEDRQLLVCRGGAVTVRHIDDGRSAALQWQRRHFPQVKLDRRGCRHFMLKEILEQWHTVAQAARLCDMQLAALADKIAAYGTLYLTGAGAAYFVAEQIAHMIRRDSGIRAQAIPAYDYTCYLPLMQPGEVLLAISQSGETADTLQFIQQAKNLGVKVASVVNMPGATLTQVSDYAFNSQSGPEACVLSTKSGTAQLTFGYLLSRALAGRTASARDAIRQLAQSLSHYLDSHTLQAIASLAQQLRGEHLYLLGEGQYTAAAKIGALNIKEASYIHAESFVAGELKHGVIALIEAGTPVIFFMDADNRDYIASVAAEVKARGGFTIGIAPWDEGGFDSTVVLPPLAETAGVISSIIPCQILAYYLSIQRGLNPDKPRNLAKSVTVI